VIITYNTRYNLVSRTIYHGDRTRTFTVKNNKISHEHIYWDQASVLVQIGLLKPEKIPITGIEQTKKLVELSKSQKQTGLSSPAKR
jgi:hypothetical protein